MVGWPNRVWRFCYIVGMSCSCKKSSCRDCFPRRSGEPVVPELTGLQCLVVSLLFEGEMSSNQLRDELMRRGYTNNRTAFIRLMGRLISGAIVTYSICGNVPEGSDSLGRQNRYQVSNLGVILWKAAREFYLSFDPPPEDLEAVEVSVAEFAEYGPKERKKMADEQFTEEFMETFERERKRYGL